jgi:translation initiation factor RLI1
MVAKTRRVRVATATFFRGEHLRIRIEKLTFAKAAEHNFSSSIFTITKVINRCSRAVYELEDLKCSLTEGQFHQDELTPVALPAGQLIDKILD